MKSTRNCNRCGNPYFVGEESLGCETCDGDVEE